MEAYAVARAAQSFGAPFLAIKDIANNELEPSNTAGAETGVGESIVLDEIGRRAAIVAAATIAHLGSAHAGARAGK